MTIIYPRPCPTCGKKLNDRNDFPRQEKNCGSNVKVQCLHCETMFSRKNAMKAHVKKFHSEPAKRKAEDTAQLLRVQLLNSEKVPQLSVESQTGGTLTYGKRALDEVESILQRHQRMIANKLTTLMSMVAVRNHCLKQTFKKWVHQKHGKRQSH